MSVPAGDPILDIAEGVSSLIADCGYAFVEEDKVEALADALSRFLETAGIAVDPLTAAENIARTAAEHALLVLDAPKLSRPFPE